MAEAASSHYAVVFGSADAVRPASVQSSLPRNTHWGILGDRPRWSDPGKFHANSNSNSSSELERGLHGLLDLLPAHLAFQLDLVWLAEAAHAADRTPVGVYGALKRAVRWHGAAVTVLVNGIISKGGNSNPFLEDVRADVRRLGVDGPPDFLRPNVFWRGALAFYDDAAFALRSLPGFQLLRQAKEEEEDGSSPPRLAKHLQAMSACPLRAVPLRLLTDRALTLRAPEAQSDFVRDDSLFGTDGGVVARLSHCDVDGLAPGLMEGEAAAVARSTAEWNKAVTNGTVEDRCPDESLERPLQATYFLLCRLEGDVGDGRDLTAVEIDPGRTEKAPLSSIAIGIQSRLARLPAAEAKDPNDDDDMLDESAWEERRLLAFLDHQRKLAKPQAGGGGGTAIGAATMTPGSGDFVVLEAKELLKLFTADGEPRRADLEVLRPRRTPRVDAAALTEAWPAVLCQEYPGLHFNRSEQSEERDREAVRLQRLYVGGARETASTCSSSVANNARPEVVATKTAASAPPTRKQKTPRRSRPTKETTSSLNRDDSSGKKRARPGVASGKAPPDVFRAKLRNAVYDALRRKGIGEDSRLFRGCFKKLFEICAMYAKDMPKTAKSTKLWLATVAQTHVDTVANLEIALFGN